MEVEVAKRRSLALAYSDSDPSGRASNATPCFFVHGFSHNHSVWHATSGLLSEERRVVAVDLRGHGASPWSPPGAYSPSDYAEDLIGVLDALNLPRVHLVGHSLGGNVSTLFASLSPARVASLTLVDTGPALEAAGTAQIVDELEDALESFPSVEMFRRRLGQLHPTGDSDALDRLATHSLVERLDGRFDLALDPGVMGDASSSGGVDGIEQALWAALRSLRCPTLVVRGGVSSILREKVAREMVDETLSDGRLVTLPQAGHAVMLEDAVGLARALIEFWQD